MVSEHEDEFGTTPENLRMDSIQKRFPNDDLQLRESPMSAAQVSGKTLVIHSRSLDRMVTLFCVQIYSNSCTHLITSQL